MTNEASNSAASLLDKARAVTAGVGGLKRAFTGAHAVAHQAEIREALTRTELTVALHASLSQRAALEAKLRDEALRRQAMAFPIRLRRNNRLSQLLDRLLARLGTLGQTLVVFRSSLSRGPCGVPAIFDPDWYLARNADVARREIPPLVHYLTSGGREGRSPGLLFDDEYYRSQHAEALASTSLTTLEHYLRAGAAGSGSPHPLFDTSYYLAQNPTLASGEDPVSHYIREGGGMGLSPHPMFDPAWYLTQAPDAAGRPALVHYLTTGWRKRLSPHPLFDTAWYLERWPDVAETGMPPLLHFIRLGGFEGRSPSPWFDLAHYVEQRGAALPPAVNPAVDYLLGGAWAINEARVGFPTAAYIAACPDLVRDGVTPLEHWARRAAR